MKKITFLFILLCTTLSFSQQEASKWYFGQGAAVDFSTPTPTNIPGSQLNTNEGCSSFADSSGNLLFYIGAPTLGDVNLTIWDRNNNPMPNGIGLQGDASSSQSALTIPAPGLPNIYYIFTVGALSSGTPGFFYYTLDMTLNGGLGDIVGGSTSLHESSDADWTEKVTAVKGDECNTFWVVSQVLNEFWAYKVTDTGVITTPVKSSVSQVATDARGYLKVSPDGSKLATAHYAFSFGFVGESYLILYDFDNSTGIVTNNGEKLIDTTKISQDGSPYGVEFSNSSEKLYVSTHNGFSNKVFQFDLNRSDVEASKTLINQRNGRFRGALQMALNGRIYATTPFSYSTGTSFLDEIVNPSDDAADIVYNEDAINLGSGLAMQGLPPFISSLLLPLELTEVGSTITLNNQTHNFCNGDDITFSPEAITGSPNYIWTFDNGTSTVELSNGASPNLSLTNINNTSNGLYNLTATVIDDCGNPTILEGEFEIIVYEQPTATTPLPIQLCDDDNDGFMDFNLTDNEADILNGQSTVTFEVVYFDDAAYTNQIVGADITTFTSSGQTIYARVRTISNTNCIADITFDLEVYQSAFPALTADIPNLSDCDNTSVGTDTDGLILFNLNDRKTDILNSQPAADFTLTYFLDATYTTQIPENTIPFTGNDITSYQNDPSLNDANGRQTIYVRMTNNLTAAFTTPCFTNTSFDIEVYELPVLNTVLGPPYELVQCDDPSNDGEANFNLNQVNGDVIDPITTETFIFYTSLAAAQAGTPGTEIPDATVHNVTGNTDVVWVRVITVNGCYRTAQVDLIISPSAINPDYQFYNCDDDLDVNGNDTAANDDTDGITIFDFQNEIDQIAAAFLGTAGVMISVHHTEADADAGLNPIDPTTYSTYRNIVSPNQELLWVRVVSSLGNDCLANGNFITLNVNPIPNIDTTLTLAPLCDDDTDIAMDDTNGFGVEFDLESLTNNIENLQPDFPTVPYNVTYHLSDAEALSGVNPQSSPFRNTANNQIIYVRVVNTDTTCINPHMTFTLDVTPLPIVNFTGISLASQCDNTDDGDDTNGTGVTFDLGSLRSDFENLQPDFPAVNYTVTYHETIADAQALPALNPLPDLYPNTANNQTIFVRIENDDTGCIRIEESPIFLVVDPLPIISAITVDPRCDDDLDGDDMNEVVTWVLDDYVSDYNDMQTVTTATYDVTFHTAIPTTTANQITTTGAYPNNSNSEEIFVRVTNTDTTCFREILGFELVVNSLPDFELMTDDIVCENILPHYIAVENPLENDYNYEWFNASGTSIGNNQILEITDTNDLTITGVDYTVKVTNPTTFCERSKIINLKKSSIATLTDDDIVSVEFDSPGNSIEIIITNLGSGNYEYALDHPYDSRPYQDEPIFEGLLGGIYTLKINDKNECGEFSKDIALIDYPKFLTPNNDGYNDLWQLIGLDTAAFTISPIQIYDRFGKIVAIVNPIQGEGWDGLYKNEMLPSSDYWFSLELTDNQGNIKRHRGHFSLVRR